MHIEVKRMVSSHFKIWDEIKHFPVGVSNTVMLFDGNRLKPIDEIPPISLPFRGNVPLKPNPLDYRDYKTYMYPGTVYRLKFFVNMDSMRNPIPGG